MIATTIHKGLSILFKSQIIKALAGDLAGEAGEKVSEILEEHFNLTAAEIAKNFQDSYSYAVVTIGSGLAKSENQRGFLNVLFQSKVNNEFLTQLEQGYFSPFIAQQGLVGENLTLFRQQALEHCQKMAKLQLFQDEDFVSSEAKLVSFINVHETNSLTDLLLTLIQKHYVLSEELIAYLQFKDLLAHSLLFFLHEQLRKEPRFKTTLAALQQQKLMVDVANIKTLMQSTQDILQQAVDAEDFDEVGKLSKKLKRFQKIELVTEKHYSEWLAFNRQFSHWSALTTLRLEQVLLAMPTLSQRLDDIKEDTGKIKGDVEQILALLQQLMMNSNLSPQIKLRDELTHHNANSLKLIRKVIALLPYIDSSSPCYSQVAISLGSVISSQGDLKWAEVLFTKAYQQTNNDDERALSQFNLFQVFIRQQCYDKAFLALQEAVLLKPKRYALHNVHTYTLQCILGAGGMGCVFLAKNHFEDKQVVIKCFWEMVSESPKELCKEAFLMARIAGQYVPQPLACDFVDEDQQRGYFVTEYISDTIDGEAWLKKYGAVDVQTGIAIGLQIAEGLQLAHQEGIYHLDLKPANILLKRLGNGEIQVKIIDFGLANIAPSLGQEMLKEKHHGSSLFFQATVFGTLNYAPPEQQGETEYGLPSERSDVYSFGKTLYRLLTAESPQTLHPGHLQENVKLFELLCDCVNTDPQQRPTIVEVVQQLNIILKESDPSPSHFWLKIAGLSVIASGSLLFAWSQLSPSASSPILPEMIPISAGSFMMGCVSGKDCYDSEKPIHRVTVAAFKLAKTEVTFEEWDICVKAKACAYKSDDEGWGRGQRPVIHVSWNDAQDYVQWLSNSTGKAYRLPTEAEWEYAARANTNTAYPWGDTVNHNYANYGNKIGKTTLVGSYPANAFGLHDMHGNVWEWVADSWHKNYQDAPTDGRVWEGKNAYRVLRGGCWNGYGELVRSAMRSNGVPDSGRNTGLRLALGD